MLIPLPSRDKAPAPNFYSSGGGADLSVNGAFAADTDWIKGTGWTIAAGVASKSTGTLSFLQANVAALTIGEKVLIRFDVLNYSAGNVTPFAGSAGTGTARAANGTFTEEIEVAGDGVLQFEGDATFVGDIDNVFAIKTRDRDRLVVAAFGNLYALRGHNDNAATRYIQVFDAAAAVADDTSPLMEVEVAANSDFNFFSVMLTFPWHFFLGLYVCISTTTGFKTLAGADATFYVQYK